MTVVSRFARSTRTVTPKKHAVHAQRATGWRMHSPHPAPFPRLFAAYIYCEDTKVARHRQTFTGNHTKQNIFSSSQDTKATDKKTNNTRLPCFSSSRRIINIRLFWKRCSAGLQAAHGSHVSDTEVLSCNACSDSSAQILSLAPTLLRHQRFHKTSGA